MGNIGLKWDIEKKSSAEGDEKEAGDDEEEDVDAIGEEVSDAEQDDD